MTDNTQEQEYERIREHLGHDIVIVEYGDGDNVAIECETCNVVLYDADAN